MLKCRKRQDEQAAAAAVLMPSTIINYKTNSITRERSKSNLRTTIIQDQSLENAIARDNSQGKISIKHKINR